MRSGGATFSAGFTWHTARVLDGASLSRSKTAFPGCASGRSWNATSKVCWITTKERPGDGDRWLAQADDLARELEPSNAAALLHRLASRYHKTGRWELAAETMRMIIDRY